MHRHGSEALATCQPVRGNLLDEQRTRQCRRHLCSSAQSGLGKGRQQGRKRGVAPRRMRHGGRDASRFGFEAGRWFDLEIHRQPEFDAASCGFLQGGQRLTGKALAEPPACIEAPQHFPRGFGHPPMAVGGALQGFVVNQHRYAIGGEHDVELDATAANAHGRLQAGQGILRCQCAPATMGQHPWPGPDVHLRHGWSAQRFGADPRRATAVSSASLAGFRSAHTALSSSSRMRRTPSRPTRADAADSGVGGLLLS